MARKKRQSRKRSHSSTHACDPSVVVVKRTLGATISLFESWRVERTLVAGLCCCCCRPCEKDPWSNNFVVRVLEATFSGFMLMLLLSLLEQRFRCLNPGSSFLRVYVVVVLMNIVAFVSFNDAMSFLLRIICFLDVTLCYVGENAGGMLGYLKLFGIKLGIDITELFEMSQEPIVPADHLKAICYAGIVVLLCYFGMSKKTSSVAHRLSGVAVLAAIGHFFWIILSPMPYSYFLCFVFVSGFLIVAASKNTS